MSKNADDTRAGLIRLPWEAVTYVQHFYDGPLIGLCVHAGRIHHFSPDPAAPLGERLLVYPLTDKEIERELALKTLFEQTVGTHWSRDRPLEQRRVVNPHGSPAYEALAAARFPDLESAGRACYIAREPIAVIE